MDYPVTALPPQEVNSGSSTHNDRLGGCSLLASTQPPAPSGIRNHLNSEGSMRGNCVSVVNAILKLEVADIEFQGRHHMIHAGFLAVSHAASRALRTEPQAYTATGILSQRLDQLVLRSQRTRSSF